MAKGTKYSQQFKEDAVQYRLDHPELPLRKAAENLGVSESALKNWMKAAKEHKGEVPTRGSGNYTSEEAKEIARLQRELRDTKDALGVLKKAIGILGNFRKRRETSLLIISSAVCIGNTDTSINPGFVDIKSTAIFTKDFKRQ